MSVSAAQGRERGCQVTWARRAEGLNVHNDRVPHRAAARLEIGRTAPRISGERGWANCEKF
eukprot:3643486-Prymnesium_polylepis.1